MTDPRMAAWLAEDELRVLPRQGRFDVDRVAAWIGALGFSFRDAKLPSMFVVAADAPSRAKLQAERQAHPEAGFPHVLLIEVTAEEIHVAPAESGGLEQLSAAFLTWLTKEYDCQVRSELGADLTDPPPSA